MHARNHDEGRGGEGVADAVSDPVLFSAFSNLGEFPMHRSAGGYAQKQTFDEPRHAVTSPLCAC